MKGQYISLVSAAAVALVGVITIIYQIYQIVVIDAKARNLKHPKFWGLLAMNGNNSSGILMYLIARRKYPIVALSDAKRADIEKRKKAAGIGLIFLAVGSIALIISSLFF